MSGVSRALIPESLLARLAPLSAKRLFRGLSSVPVRLTPSQLAHFTRTSLGRWSKDKGVPPGEYHDEIFEYRPAEAFREYTSRMERCEGCTAGERRTVQFILAAINSSVRRQYYSPFRSESKGWGTPYDRLLGELTREVPAEDGSRELLRWASVGFLITANKEELGPTYSKTKPVPPYDIEYEALGNPDVVNSKPFEEAIQLVWLNGKWHSAKDANVQAEWQDRVASFDRAVALMFEGAEKGLSAQQVAASIAKLR